MNQKDPRKWFITSPFSSLEQIIFTTILIDKTAHPFKTPKEADSLIIIINPVEFLQVLNEREIVFIWNY